ncbi:MAG TPA: SxtJ family membrane protein [Vicinamibacteria bacterium]|nr:SxtJ family membrane protein [Vicinamibacteria bacterium]
MPDFVTVVVAWFAALAVWKKVLLAFATTVMVVELLFRRIAPASQAYKNWTKFFQGIGKVWTAVILSVVYVGSVGVIGGIMRLVGKDPLDRKLDAEPSFWRDHEPNPLGLIASVRHQF